MKSVAPLLANASLFKYVSRHVNKFLSSQLKNVFLF